jgi:hypothetical protein
LLWVTSVDASYSDGYLYFMREDTLMAQPLDTSKFQLKGGPVPIAERVTITAAIVGAFSVSPSGGGQEALQLEKIAVTGGPPQTLCQMKGLVASGAWSRTERSFSAWDAALVTSGESRRRAAFLRRSLPSTLEKGSTRCPTFFPMESTFSTCVVPGKAWAYTSAHWTQSLRSSRIRVLAYHAGAAGQTFN